MRRLLLCCAAALLAAGCALSRPASDGSEQAAKAFAPDPEMAGIYVFRDERFGGDIPMQVTVDGVPLGRTLGQTFYFVEVRPGRHRVESTYGPEATLLLDTQAGELYYVWQEVTVGSEGVRTRLHRVDEERGRAAVEECRMLQSLR